MLVEDGNLVSPKQVSVRGRKREQAGMEGALPGPSYSSVPACTYLEVI